MKSGDLLFVYGTLRRGESADLKEQARGGACFIATDEINGDLYNLGWFPGVKAEPGHFDPGKPSVRGDVFLLRDDALCKRLDVYEGYPNLYNRIETYTAGERHVWVYTYNHDVIELQRLIGGDWKMRDDIHVRMRAG